MSALPVPVVSAENLCVGYKRRGGRSTAILQGISAQLLPGQLTFLLGPNGAGKSTLLRTLVGSQKPLGGRVLLSGENLIALSARERAKRLSVVLTDPVDVGLMTVRTLVGLGRSPHLGWFSAMADDDRQTIEWALRAAGASQLADRQVIELSDGERQRSMIARALAQRPSVLVLDEPTAFLDLTRRVELIALLRKLADETGLAVLLSTHDLDLALRAADQLWLVHADGRFETGGPEDLAVGGSIERTYAASEISFDHAAGNFILARKSHGLPIAISAAEPSLHWVRRAVRRAGFDPVARDADAKWRLAVHDAQQGALVWKLDEAGCSNSGQGLSDLVNALAAIADTEHNNGDPTHDQIHPWYNDVRPAAGQSEPGTRKQLSK
ncbi:ABC transporter ATP-binding protein [Devosia submarina]|uniref:ABC transporter ATP-binding protein n=1 Tax=Devosia submarina TaxID=1173082 RepID=UPI000D3A9621|nr:ABC transporter ATP-binding protein [Devosia submarina]